MGYIRLKMSIPIILGFYGNLWQLLPGSVTCYNFVRKSLTPIKSHATPSTIQAPQDTHGSMGD
jgi:hypothetical protein